MYLFALGRRLFFGASVTVPPSVFAVPKDADMEVIGADVRRIIRKLYGGRALQIRAVDGGSSNAEESELTMLGNAYYDIERFGLSFVASPRHADMLFVTGPVTRNLETAVKTTYEATPHPCIVVAVGVGSCTCGIWKVSYAVVGAVENFIPTPSDHGIRIFPDAA